MFGRKSTFKFSLVLLILSALFCASVAAAAGRVVWTKRKISESNSTWRVDVQFHMKRAPDFSLMPVTFTFEPISYFERSLVDGREGPQLRTVPLVNKQSLIETVDVGFMDPSSGKIQARTRFSFKVSRDRGFEAGEYKVKVKDKRTGKKLGTKVLLTLNGENEIIDRRSMVFETKKKKNKEKTEGGQYTEPEYDPKEDPSSDEYWEGGATEPEQDGALPPPPPLQERPGACSLPAANSSSGSGSDAFLALLAIAGLAFSRRRTPNGA